MGIKIASVSKALPKVKITNDQLSEFLDTNDEWIYSRTGIKTRVVCATGETMADLCAEAANKAIEAAGMAKEDIDLVICSTVSGDYFFPSLACTVIERLGIDRPAFDVNAGCTGFIYSLDVADKYISSKSVKNVLIICAEMLSRFADWNDRATCVLFGDGAAGCVVTEGDALKYMKLSAVGNTPIMNMPISTGNCPFRENVDAGYLYMNGQEIFKFAVSAIEDGAKAACEAMNMSIEDVDYFLLHQANKRIIDFARTKLKQPEEKFPCNIGAHGNISSFTIPALLSEMIEEGKIEKGTTLVMSAFGAGLTAGTCVMIWE